MGKAQGTRSNAGKAIMTDFHTIRLNGPDYLLFLKAKTHFIEHLKKDLQNNDVMHLIMTKIDSLIKGDKILADLKNLEEE